MGDLDILRATGLDIDNLSPEEREVLARLDPSEVRVLASIRAQLKGDEVSGFDLPTDPTRS